MKYIRVLQDLIGARESGIAATIDLWTPLISESIKTIYPEFKKSELEEITLEELSDIWEKLMQISEIKFTVSDDDKKMDWGEIYGRIATGIGVLHREIDEITLPEVEQILEYLNAHPTEAEILAAVYKVESRSKKLNLTKEEYESRMGEVAPTFFNSSQAEFLTPEMRENIRWAEETVARMKNKQAN